MIGNRLLKIKDKWEKITISLSLNNFSRLDNPSDEVIKFALSKDKELINDVKEINKEIHQYMLSNYTEYYTNLLKSGALNKKIETKDGIEPQYIYEDIKKDIKNIKYYSELPDSVVRNLFEENKEYLSVLQNQCSEKIKKEFIERDSLNIKYLNNPSLSIQKTAIIRNPMAFNVITNLKKEVKLNLLNYINTYNNNHKDNLFLDLSTKTMISNKGFEDLVNDKRSIEELREISGEDDIEIKMEDFRKSEELDDRILYSQFNDKDTVLNEVKRKGISYGKLNNEMKNDIEIAFAAIDENSQSFKFVPKELKEKYGYAPIDFYENVKSEINRRNIKYLNTQETMDLLVQNKVSPVELLEKGSDSLKGNEKFVKECLKRDVEAYKHISEKLQNNSGIIEQMLKKDGSMLRYIPEDKKSVRELVLIAVNENKDSFDLAANTITKQYKNVNDFIEDKPSIELSLKNKKSSLMGSMKEMEDEVNSYGNEVSKFNDTYGDGSSDTDSNKRKNK